jgi:light-independent protochlorophyllide reductase subunit B
MGFEGANVLFDTWVHPLMMGLEEHLITMFREDFEFHEGAAASHLGRHARGPEPVSVIERDEAVEPVHDVEPPQTALPQAGSQPVLASPPLLNWSPQAEKELGKIPFFVRGKARRNTERYACERSISLITLDTLYDAKAHFSR